MSAIDFRVVWGIVKIKCRGIDGERHTQTFSFLNGFYCISLLSISNFHVIKNMISIHLPAKVALTMGPGTNPIYWWKQNRHRVHSPGDRWCFSPFPFHSIERRRSSFFISNPFFICKTMNHERFNNVCLPNTSLLSAHYISSEQLMETAKKQTTMSYDKAEVKVLAINLFREDILWVWSERHLAGTL